MKKPVAVLVSLTACILLSCFEFVGTGTSKRILNLALSAPGDVAKLHIGVFDGVVTNETLLYKQSVAAGSSIPLDLPAGNNRIVVVWAEGYDGLANYFGSIGPITIDESGDTPLPIQMKRFSNNAASFNVTLSIATTQIINWKTIMGALSYELAYHDQKDGIYFNVIVMGNTYDTGLRASNPIDIYKIRVYSSVFDLSSEWSN